MNYVLDSDILIYFLKGHNTVVKHIASQEPDRIYTTIINQAELLFGAFNSIHKNRNLELIDNFMNKIESLPFCTEAARVFAEQKASLKKNGSLIADMDLMIASICLTQKMVLVTNNEKHFHRIKKLKMENWSKA